MACAQNTPLPVALQLDGTASSYASKLQRSYILVQYTTEEEKEEGFEDESGRKELKGTSCIVITNDEVQQFPITSVVIETYK